MRNWSKGVSLLADQLNREKYRAIKYNYLYPYIFAVN